MSMPPRNFPRFLPMLTEVVDPADIARHSVALTPDPEAIIQAVMQKVNLLLEQRLGELAESMVRQLLLEQLQPLKEDLRRELALVVRQAVSDAMTPDSDLHK